MKLDQVNCVPMIAAIIAILLSSGKYDLTDAIGGVIALILFFPFTSNLKSSRMTWAYSMIFGLFGLAIMGWTFDGWVDRIGYRERQLTLLLIWVIFLVVFYSFISIRNKPTAIENL